MGITCSLQNVPGHELQMMLRDRSEHWGLFLEPSDSPRILLRNCHKFPKQSSVAKLQRCSGWTGATSPTYATLSCVVAKHLAI